MDYTQEELIEAINSATQTINDKTEACTEYTRGTNDCAALLVAYDKALRGSSSKAELDFQWRNPRDFVVKLGRQGFTVASYLEYCGYELIKNKRPVVGDVAFAGGALIASPRGWLSTSEKNTGVAVVKQLMFLEMKMHVIARPIKD